MNCIGLDGKTQEKHSDARFPCHLTDHSNNHSHYYEEMQSDWENAQPSILMERIKLQEKSNANRGALKKKTTYRLDSDPARYRNTEAASERGSHNSATLSRNAPSRITSLSGRYRRSLLAGRALRNEGPFGCAVPRRKGVLCAENNPSIWAPLTLPWPPRR